MFVAPLVSSSQFTTRIPAIEAKQRQTVLLKSNIQPRNEPTHTQRQEGVSLWEICRQPTQQLVLTECVGYHPNTGRGNYCISVVVTWREKKKGGLDSDAHTASLTQTCESFWMCCSVSSNGVSTSVSQGVFSGSVCCSSSPSQPWSTGSLGLPLRRQKN